MSNISTEDSAKVKLTLLVLFFLCAVTALLYTVITKKNLQQKGIRNSALVVKKHKSMSFKPIKQYYYFEVEYKFTKGVDTIFKKNTLGVSKQIYSQFNLQDSIPILYSKNSTSIVYDESN